MKKPEREYPDIEFLETDTETIESNMIALYEELVNKELVKQGKREKYKVYPASPERLFIAWCAAIIVQQRVLINETAKKNVPRYAKGEYLDSLAELFKDIERLPACRCKIPLLHIGGAESKRNCPAGDTDNI